MGTWTPGPAETTGDDTFTGDNTGEFARGDLGNDTLNGNGGNDVLFGDGGNDTINGGDGDDDLRDDSGNNFLYGGDGNDEFRITGNGNNTLDGGDGDDFFRIQFNATGVFTVAGGSGTDILNLNYAILSVGSTQTGIETIALTQNGVVAPASFFNGITNFWAGGGALHLLESGVIDFSTVNVSGNFVLDSPQSPPQTFTNGSFSFLGTDGDDGLILNAAATAAVNADGGAGDDVLRGGAMNDRLYGGYGNDELYGEGGNDTFILADDADLASGGAGDDIFEVRGLTEATIDGGDGVDTLYLVPATSSGEVSGLTAGSTIIGIERVVMVGGGGFVTLTPGALPTTGEFWASGGTLVHSSAGTTDLSAMSMPSTFTFGTTNYNARLGFRGSSGDDVFLMPLATEAFLTADAGDGDDLVQGGAGGDLIGGGNGSDTLFGNGGADLLGGGSGDDDISGGAGADTLDGGDGVDDLSGGDGDDVLEGGAGADILSGGDGRDVAAYVNAHSGIIVDLHTNTTSSGDAQGDVLISIEGAFGSDYADTFISGAAADRFVGGGGIDLISYAHSTQAVIVDLASGISWDGAVNDVVEDIENVIGSAFNDQLWGDHNDNRFFGGGGADAHIGGDGIDTIDYSASSAGVTVSLSAGIGSGGDAQGDTYSSIENVVGTNFADLFFSNSAANTFAGGAGVDTISYAGVSAGVIVNLQAGLTWDGVVNDVISGIENIVGGAGNDQLWGDAGNNLINGGTGGADVLAGFGGFDTVSYANSSTGVIIDMGSSLTWDGVNNDQLHAFHGAIGSGFNDDFRGTGGVDWLDGGFGQDLYLGNDDADTFVFRAGQANGDIVRDFAGQGAVLGDNFLFIGYGTAAQGATFTQLDATHWQIRSWDGAITEVITLQNGASVHSSDYLFGPGP